MAAHFYFLTHIIFVFLDFFVYLLKSTTMAQEEKQLLLKDLCTRLPYGIKGLAYIVGEPCNINIVGIINESIVTSYESPMLDLINLNSKDITIKPYLRPMSSMTTEEEYEYHQIRKRNSAKSLSLMDCSDHLQQLLFPIIAGTESIDWLNAHHFDYHIGYDEEEKKWKSMIEKGLAIEAPEGMYNITK